MATCIKPDRVSFFGCGSALSCAPEAQETVGSPVALTVAVSPAVVRLAIVRLAIVSLAALVAGGCGPSSNSAGKNTDASTNANTNDNDNENNNGNTNSNTNTNDVCPPQYECGTYIDPDGEPHDCGECENSFSCRQNSCVCDSEMVCGGVCCTAEQVCHNGGCCTPVTCAAAGYECGENIPDGCGGTIDSCGTCAAPETCGGGGTDYICGEPDPLAYPTRSPYRLKAIQPDFWQPMDEISGNNTGGVAMNLVWAQWEPTPKNPPCDPNTEQEYDNRCYIVQGAVDDAIREWTDRGLVVTAIVYGVPAWARTAIDCSPCCAGFDVFCAPDDAGEYGRFAGMLAQRYNGLNGNGRIADFVIHNEVNHNDWFDIGCGQGTACDPDAWVATYADNYNAAYDAVTAHQPEAKVLTSFTHHFDLAFDDPSAEHPTLSVKTFLTEFAPQVGGRAWRVAYHPYPPNLLYPEFSATDLPRVTYGNIGILVGWLRQTFPATPSCWTIQLTESGINSLAPYSSQSEQADWLCLSFRNILGTPGIENHIYHRMKDHSAETAAGLGVGLADENHNLKQAWTVWALANRNDLNPPQLDCGFENLPYTVLQRGYHPQKGHWVSTRMLPAGFTPETSGWKLFRAPQPQTVMLYECQNGEHNFLTTDPGCENHPPRGPVGYIYTNPEPGTVPLYRCRQDNPLDHMVTTHADCEGWIMESTLGYAVP